MLPPSMDYEVGKGRIFELEQKAAARRQVEEALAGRRRQQPGVLSRLLRRLNGAVTTVGRAGAESPPLGGTHEQKQQPTAP